MPVLTPWRMGSATAGYIDLPDPQIDGVSVDYSEPGGEARSKDGTLLFDRTGPVKRSMSLKFDPAAPAALWAPMLGLFYDSPGPYEIYDPLRPNLLSYDDRLGDGWVTSAGSAISARPDMRIPLNAAALSAQTAKTTAPSFSTLVPVTPGVTYTAAITAETVAGTGTATFAVYGYTSPGATGVIQDAVGIAGAGRVKSTFTAGAGIVLIALRLAYGTGSLLMLDPTIFPGGRDPGRSIYLARMSGVSEQPFSIADRSGFSATLAEI